MHNGHFGQREFLQAAEVRRRELASRRIAKADAFAHVHAHRRSELESHYVAALGRLGEILSPNWTCRRFMPSWDSRGFRRSLAIVHSSEWRRSASRNSRHDSRRSQGIPRFVHRAALRHPSQGSLCGELARLHAYRTPLASVPSTRPASPLGQSDGSRLSNTELRDVGWWRLSYYQNQSAAEEILARFPERRMFSEVRRLPARSPRSRPRGHRNRAHFQPKFPAGRPSSESTRTEAKPFEPLRCGGSRFYAARW